MKKAIKKAETLFDGFESFLLRMGERYL